MTVANSVATVGAAAVVVETPVSGSGPTPCKVLFMPEAGNTGTVYIGGPTVTADAAATGGIPLPAAGVAVDLLPSDVVWAIATAASQKVRILVVGA